MCCLNHKTLDLFCFSPEELDLILRSNILGKRQKEISPKDINYMFDGYASSSRYIDYYVEPGVTDELFNLKLTVIVGATIGHDGRIIDESVFSNRTGNTLKVEVSYSGLFASKVIISEISSSNQSSLSPKFIQTYLFEYAYDRTRYGTYRCSESIRDRRSQTITKKYFDHSGNVQKKIVENVWFGNPSMTKEIADRVKVSDATYVYDNAIGKKTIHINGNLSEEVLKLSDKVTVSTIYKATTPKENLEKDIIITKIKDSNNRIIKKMITVVGSKDSLTRYFRNSNGDVKKFTTKTTSIIPGRFKDSEIQVNVLKSLTGGLDDEP